jgi:hypothetical protein
MPFAQHGLNWRSLSKINQAKKASTGWSHSLRSWEEQRKRVLERG